MTNSLRSKASQSGQSFGLDLVAEAAVVGGHVAPTEQDLPFACSGLGDRALAARAQSSLPGQEHGAAGIVPRRRQLDAQIRALRAQEPVGGLDQDAGAVTGQRIGTDRTAVVQIDQDL
jgi:hypothetical protein